MIIVSVKLASWDNTFYQLSKIRGEHSIKADDFHIGDSLIIKTDLGMDLCEISKIEQMPETEKQEVDLSSDVSEKEDKKEIGFILRKANSEDIKKWKEKNKNKKKTIKKCQELAKKKKLTIKIIDVIFSFDGGRVTCAFTASGRIDFRELVKDMAQEFHKSIRMHQVGARQIAGLSGNIGPCGRTLCCSSFLGKLGSVTTAMIANQQLSHRGPERLTGVCGRLKCCLLYEEDMYKELIKKMPPIGAEIKTKNDRGKVVEWHVLKQTVTIIREKDKEKTKTEVSIADIKS